MARALTANITEAGRACNTDMLEKVWIQGHGGVEWDGVRFHHA